MTENSSKNIKVGAVLTYITQFFSTGISFVYVPIMLGVLGQEEYGLYALVQSLISYLQMSEMGIGTTATRYNSKYIAEGNRKDQQKINGMFLLLYAAIAVICCIAGAILYGFLPQIYAKYTVESIVLIQKLFLISVLNLVINFAFKIFNAIIIAYEEYIYLKIITLLQTIIGPIGMLCVLYLGKRSVGMLLVTTSVSLLFGLAQMFFCLLKLRVRFVFRGQRDGLLKEILNFTFFVFLASLATQLFNNTDKVIISIICNETAVAVYAIVLQLSMYYNNFSSVFSALFLPRLTHLVMERNEDGILQILVKIGRIQTVVSMLIVTGFASIGVPFINRWVGADYRDAYLLTLIVMIAQITSIAQAGFMPMLQAKNLHRGRAMLGVAVAVVRILLCVVMTQQIGLFGCALATLLGCVVNIVVNNIYYVVRVGVNIKKFWCDIAALILKICPISVAVYLVSRIFTPVGWVQIIACGAAIVVIYASYSYFLVLNDYEKNAVRTVLGKVFRKVTH